MDKSKTGVEVAMPKIPIQQITEWLERDRSNFILTNVDNRNHGKGTPQEGKPMCRVKGYSSLYVTVYIDSFQKEVSLYTVDQPRLRMKAIMIVEANKSLLNDFEVLKAFICEKEAFYKKQFGQPKKRKR
ncbi:MAG: hypothetical protein K0U41_03085 [Gammaproteobacteria bacterium]|nr:hypothetical protein [Gammaproteobacteria bacterium]